MARRRAPIPLNVFLNEKLVGRLTRQKDGAIDFQYDQSWLDWENALPVSLSLPLREDRYTGRQAIAVFNSLLPERVIPQVSAELGNCKAQFPIKIPLSKFSKEGRL
jgi:HipA-like protein